MVTTFTRHDDLSGAEFRDTPMRGARFVGADLSRAVMRGIELDGVDVDSPWLFEAASFRVNGVDVIPFVDAELDRRFPGRELRRAPDPAGLLAAHEAVQATWDATIDRAAGLPAGAVHRSVDGEWSLAQTLRHLVMATDVWLGKAILREPEPYHPLGLANPEAADAGLDLSVFATGQPSYDEVLAARADRVGKLRDFLASVTPELLDEPRRNPWAPARTETVRSCLHVILGEEWEHHRFAARDLDAIEQQGPH